MKQQLEAKNKEISLLKDQLEQKNHVIEENRKKTYYLVIVKIIF